MFLELEGRCGMSALQVNKQSVWYSFETNLLEPLRGRTGDQDIAASWLLHAWPPSEPLPAAHMSRADCHWMCSQNQYVVCVL